MEQNAQHYNYGHDAAQDREEDGGGNLQALRQVGRSAIRKDAGCIRPKNMAFTLVNRCPETSGNDSDHVRCAILGTAEI